MAEGREGQATDSLHLKSGDPFAFAGLWETWRHGDEAVETTAILTTEPNELAGTVHNRMPVILRPEYYGEWLNPNMQDVGRLAPMLAPYAADEMEATAANPFVNNARNEGAECLTPA
jgi:putative SOS response-associated peptidase YedK